MFYMFVSFLSCTPLSDAKEIMYAFYTGHQHVPCSLHLFLFQYNRLT